MKGSFASRSSLSIALALALAGCEPGEAPAGDERFERKAYVDSGAQCIGAAGPAPLTITFNDAYQVLAVWAPQYTANPTSLFTGAWTNWYQTTNTLHQSLAKLAVMRGILEKYNLYDMYLSPLPAGACGPEAATVRQIDGTCNDLLKPTMGSAGIRFGRNVPPLLRDPATGAPYKNPAAHPDYANLMSPNPRDVSRTLFKRTSTKEVPFLNMLAASWVQFQVHDWMSHGENHPTEYWNVPLAKDDEFRTRFGITELRVSKSMPDDTRTPTENAMLPPSFKNEVTHWWDASQVYGSDLATANRLRTFEGGHLRVDANGLLPVAADGFEDTGMRRNWWIGLAMLHNLFAAEHNAIADMLAESYPDWTDQQLYDKARMINAAVIAKIHTVEWTPAILPSQGADIGMNVNWYGLEKYMPPADAAKARAAFGPAAAPVIDGVVGGQTDLKGVNYTLTEEFVSVYRMHPLLPDAVEVYSVATREKTGAYRTETTRNAGARGIEETHGMVDLFYSFGISHPGALVLQNYPKFIQELNIPFVGIFDMGTVDIIRDRERGVPRYNEFRRQLRLKPLASLEELTSDPLLLTHLRKLYGTDKGAIERVDLLVGTLAEAQRPTCHGFGETLFNVFTLMATRRLHADRFYTTSFNADVYTPEGMAWIDGASMKDILLRNYPELADTGLATVNNAFYPWE